MHVDVEFISASSNLVYNALELTQDWLVYGAHHALALYDLKEERVVKTFVEHEGRINCVRFLKDSKEKWLLSSGTDGRLNIWENLCRDNSFLLETRFKYHAQEGSVVVCDGILLSEGDVVLGYITSLSRVVLCQVNVTADGKQKDAIQIVQEIDLKLSVALDLTFHKILPQNELLLALGMDSGEVGLYGRAKTSKQLSKMCSLKKHEDWVRCITFITLENGDTLLASGGQDSFIAIWRFTGPGVQGEASEINDFEFQIQHFQDSRVLFDSLIIGHEGWINSLQWNNKGELISCSSDHSIIIWENLGEIWTEKSRLGTVGGQIPGGFGAQFNDSTVVTWGFQGAIQIWSDVDGDWVVQPSVTGHFEPVSDMDYHPQGHYIVSTSADQTTRVFAPWGLSRWHEIGRPQIHGHDLFAVRCCGDFIVSGAEEKILRSFQPTEIFVSSLEEVSEITVKFAAVSHHSATLPALGLSNQTGSDNLDGEGDWTNKTLEARLDEDFLRTHTLWPEVSKLYGHVYEICCIAASPKDPLVASASQSSKPQFSTIILWDAGTWKNLGEFPQHKLNVTDLEFSPDGTRLLSVSRDRTWALWNVFRKDGTGLFSMEVLETGGYHTRALWVGSWAPAANFFVTGARDKKLAVWKSSGDGKEQKTKFTLTSVQVFDFSVTAAAVNEDNVIAVGLESGLIFLLLFNPDSNEETERLQSITKLDRNVAHHCLVKKLKFNPKEKYQLASVGADRFLKVYQLRPNS